VLALALGLLGCGGQHESQLEEVRIAVWPQVSYGPLYVAIEEGYFADEDLDVELLQLATTAATAALVNGDADVMGNYLSAGVFNSINRGVRLRIVADKGYEPADACAVDGVVVRNGLLRDGALPTLESLRGARAAVFVGRADEYLLETVVNRGGLALSDFELVQIPVDAKMDGLRSGLIDFTSWSEPKITVAAEAGIATLYVGANAVFPGGQWAHLVFGPTLLDQRPGVGERFMAAYLRGVRGYMMGKTDRNVEILGKHTGLPEDVLRRMCWAAMRSDGMVDLPSIDEFQRWAVRRGYQDVFLPSDMYWDPSFVERAAARLQPGNEPAS